MEDIDTLIENFNVIIKSNVLPDAVNVTSSDLFDIREVHENVRFIILKINPNERTAGLCPQGGNFSEFA